MKASSRPFWAVLRPVVSGSCLFVQTEGGSRNDVR